MLRSESESSAGSCTGSGRAREAVCALMRSPSGWGELQEPSSRVWMSPSSLASWLPEGSLRMDESSFAGSRTLLAAHHKFTLSMAQHRLARRGFHMEEREIEALI